MGETSTSYAPQKALHQKITSEFQIAVQITNHFNSFTLIQTDSDSVNNRSEFTNENPQEVYEPYQ
jgi:hypothetical protein